MVWSFFFFWIGLELNPWCHSSYFLKPSSCIQFPFLVSWFLFLDKICIKYKVLNVIIKMPSHLHFSSFLKPFGIFIPITGESSHSQNCIIFGPSLVTWAVNYEGHNSLVNYSLLRAAESLKHKRISLPGRLFLHFSLFLSLVNLNLSVSTCSKMCTEIFFKKSIANLFFIAIKKYLFSYWPNCCLQVLKRESVTWTYF